jgi:hypothetical protein
VAEIIQNEVGKLEFSRQIWHSIRKEAQRLSWAEIYNVIWEIPVKVVPLDTARLIG